MTRYLKINSLSVQDQDRIIEMAWEDRTPFEAIFYQFGFSEADTIALMRKTLKKSSFNLWRKRVNSGVSQKHAQKRSLAINRFKCTLQKQITLNKISKRQKKSPSEIPEGLFLFYINLFRFCKAFGNSRPIHYIPKCSNIIWAFVLIF